MYDAFEFLPLGEPKEDMEPNHDVNDEQAADPSPVFPSVAQVGTGVSISWYNASVKAWLSWGHHRVSDHKSLQISYTRRLMLSSANQTINNHWLC